MTKLPTENPLFKVLEQRVSPSHLRHRLGIELDRETKIFGQGVKVFHIENWYSIHSFIRNTLKLMLLHGRGRRNALKLDVTENEIRIPHLPEAFDDYRMLHISDLHLDINDDMAGVLRERLMGLEYDVCVMTGDFRARTFGSYDKALDAMQSVRKVMHGPVYSVLGNHDSIQMVPGLEAMGVGVLLNESISIERDGSCLHIAGIDDPHYFQADNIEKASENIPDEEVSLLLSHSPETFRHAAHVGFDVLLCGHTHGGQICLPGGIPLMSNANCPRKFCNGKWMYHGMQGYTSRGSGASVVDVRFNCPPEITLHTLRRLS
jgi:predicted MPP superfamily phosphohydrolase